MYSRQNRKSRVLFALSDAALVSLAFEAAYLTRLYLPLDRVFFLTVPTKALVLGFALLATIIGGFWMRIYDRLVSADTRTVLSETTRQCAAAAAALIFFEFFLRLDLSRPLLALYVAYGWAAMFLFRLTAGRLFGLARREFGPQHFVLIVGVDARALRIARQLEESSAAGVRLLGFLEAHGGTQTALSTGTADYQVRPVDDLPQLLRQQIIDEVIFAVGSERLSELEEIFLLCDEEGVRTRVAVDFFPHVHSDVYLERLGYTPMLTFSATPHDEVRLLAKRIIDVVLATAGFAALIPFMLLVGAAVRLTSPGPAIFRQRRCGLNGRPFVFYKFRSMVADAEQRKAALEHLNVRSTVFKIPDDPRLTSIGRFLRKFSIDEWPQLWNVIKGDMSLVGPRPAVPEEVARYHRWQRRRLRMRPGLTCLWTLAGRDDVDFETWMRLDMQYIDSWSLGLDWKILLLTIPRVITGKGAN